MKVAGAPGHRDRFRSGKINDEPKYLQMIRSFKDKGLPGHLGGKIKQELVLSKLETIRYRTASGSGSPSGQPAWGGGSDRPFAVDRNF